MRRLSTPRARRSRPHNVKDVLSEIASLEWFVGLNLLEDKLSLLLFCSFRLSLSLKRISPVASGGRQDIVPARDNGKEGEYRETQSVDPDKLGQRSPRFDTNRVDDQKVTLVPVCCAVYNIRSQLYLASLFEARAGSRMCFRLMKGGPNADIYVIFQMSASSAFISSAASRVSSVVSFHSRDARRAHKQEWLIETLCENYGRAEADPEIPSHSPKPRIQWLRKVPCSLKQVSIHSS
jgi:hypothetical protein